MVTITIDPEALRKVLEARKCFPPSGKTFTQAMQDEYETQDLKPLHYQHLYNKYIGLGDAEIKDLYSQELAHLQQRAEEPSTSEKLIQMLQDMTPFDQAASSVSTGSRAATAEGGPIRIALRARLARDEEYWKETKENVSLERVKADELHHLLSLIEKKIKLSPIGDPIGEKKKKKKKNG